MGKRIHNYFRKLGLPEDEAAALHHKYYTQYGLAVRGLMLHHEIDPVAYDKEVDGGLPLEQLLKPDPELRDMLTRMRGAKKWAFTNAGKYHATRVLNILGIHDQFAGLTYCDYAEPNFSCKPEIPYYEKAMREAQISDHTKCYLVDDSAPNIDTAKKLGWTTVHVAETLPSKHGHFQITDIHDLWRVVPEFWPGYGGAEGEGGVVGERVQGTV
ncbi:hypothetical protein HDV00_007957 [Rhizophlyctis rosea]|nr:hypothetical protein HDV00_007957 [Rhizophlyctis rosea]